MTIRIMIVIGEFFLDTLPRCGRKKERKLKRQAADLLGTMEQNLTDFKVADC